MEHFAFNHKGVQMFPGQAKCSANLREGVQGVDQLQLGVTPQSDHLVHLLQAQADAVETCHELIEAPLAHILMLPPHLSSTGKVDSQAKC